MIVDCPWSKTIVTKQGSSAISFVGNAISALACSATILIVYGKQRITSGVGDMITYTARVPRQCYITHTSTNANDENGNKLLMFEWANYPCSSWG